MGSGCFDGYGQAVEVIDNSTAIISYFHYCSNQVAGVLEKVQLNSYSVLYRKNVLLSNNNPLTFIVKIVKRPGSLGLGIIGKGNEFQLNADIIVGDKTF